MMTAKELIALVAQKHRNRAICVDTETWYFAVDRETVNVSLWVDQGRLPSIRIEGDSIDDVYKQFLLSGGSRPDGEAVSSPSETGEPANNVSPTALEDAVANAECPPQQA